MRWEDFRRSENVEDARGSGGFSGGRAGGLALGTVVILGLIGWAFGIDPSVLIGGAEILNGGSSPSQQQQPAPRGTPTDQAGQFVAAVLGDTEDRWKEIFEKSGRTLPSAHASPVQGSNAIRLQLCSIAMGPFYCPKDQHVYLDTSFFQDIEQRFRGCSGKACEFAQAYVIAHEVGHHVQNLMGILPKVTELQQGQDRAGANQLQVRVELQADCLAGVWANHSQEKWKSIEPGDIEAALQTASAIGDDRLQRQSQGHVVPMPSRMARRRSVCSG
jgi:predicted metalloprotease